MSDPMLVLIFAALMLLGFALSAIYSGAEMGIYVLNPVRMRLRAADGDRRAIRLTHELSDSRRTLAVVLIGTNAANYLGSFGLAELLTLARLTDWTLIIVQVVIFTPALFVFAETLPKELFRTHSDHWTYRLATFMKWSRHLMTWTLLLPIVRGFTWIGERAAGSKDERVFSPRHHVSQLIKEGVGAGVLSEHQTTLADRAMAMRDRLVTEVMIPWRQVTAIPDDAKQADRERYIRTRPHSRFPVTDRTGRVTGVVHWSNIVLQPDVPLATIMEPPLILPPETSLLDAISAMRMAGQTMAFVESPAAKSPSGLLALKHLVEQLTGEIRSW